jgi:hypothetical protein
MQARLTGRPGNNQAVPLHRGLECRDHVGHRGGAVENLALTVIPHEAVAEFAIKSSSQLRSRRERLARWCFRSCAHG